MEIKEYRTFLNSQLKKMGSDSKFSETPSARKLLSEDILRLEQNISEEMKKNEISSAKGELLAARCNLM